MEHFALHPDVLDSASQRLRRFVDIPAPLDQWRAVRYERPRSVVFMLSSGRSKPITVFYKIMRSRPESQGGESEWGDSMTNRLSRSLELTDRLLEQCAGSLVSPAPVLAVQPELQTVVTLGMSGRPATARGVLLHQLIPGTSTPAVFESLGKAVALIEKLSESDRLPLDSDRFWAREEKHLRRSEQLEKTERKLIHNRLSRLVECSNEMSGWRYVHGDLSSTNILLSRKQVGLIDFGWESRCRLFDLALMSYRLHFAYRPRWGRLIHDALWTGYRAEYSTVRIEAWQLVETLMLIRALRNRRPRVQAEGIAAVKRVTDDDRVGVVSASAMKSDFLWWWAG